MRVKSILTSDVTIVALGQLFQQMLTVGTGIAIARLLGSSGYGLVNLLRSLFTAVITLAPLGLDLALLKFSGQHVNDRPRIIAMVRRLRFLTFILNLTLALVIGLGLGGEIMRRFYPYDGFDQMLLVTMLGVPFAADLAILGAFYKGANRPGVFALMTLYLQPAARVVLITAAAFTWIDPLIVVAINTLQVTISALAVSLHLRGLARPAANRAPPPAWLDVRAILSGSIWMAFSLFVYGMMRFVDILLLGALATTRDVGEYAALSGIAQLVQVYPLAASQTLGPKISQLHHEGDSAGVRNELNNYIYTASLIASFIFAGIATFGDRLDLIFGPSFHFGSMIAFLMPLGYLISATLAPTGYALSMTGRHRSELAVLCIGAASLIGLCVVLIPLLGQVGAAIASAVSFTIVNVLRFFYVSRVLGFVPGRWRDFLPPLFGLGTAFLARAVVDEVAARGLIALIAACVLYTLLYAVAAALFMASQSGLRKSLADIRAKFGRTK